MRHVRILGTRGIPAQHGGFETFAEHLARYLVRHDWQVTVYCQLKGIGRPFGSMLDGIRCIHIPVRREGAVGTIEFDWKSTLHASGETGIALTLGYNTALFSCLYRLKRIPNLINMDGMEWQREKWGLVEKAWLYLNERLGCWLANHLIADNPEIANHLAKRVRRDKISTIPYGADRVDEVDPALLEPYCLEPKHFALVIARPEPENSILEIVRAFSRRRRGVKLVVLGEYYPAENAYHCQVQSAASDEVLFLGAIYDKAIVSALRCHACLYIHGHRVGGTNPSLVEALGAGSAILAHDNRFNRWVAGPGACYFTDEDQCAAALDQLLTADAALEPMRATSQARHAEVFTWDKVLESYEQLLNPICHLSRYKG